MLVAFLIEVVAENEARRLEAREGEGLHELLQRHAILQAHRDGDGEGVHQAAERGAVLVHVDEDFADAAVFIFAGAQIDLVSADDRLLRIALAALRQLLAFADHDALDDLLDDALGDDGRALRLRLRRAISSASSSSSSKAKTWLASGCESFEPSR